MILISVLPEKIACGIFVIQTIDHSYSAEQQTGCCHQPTVFKTYTGKSIIQMRHWQFEKELPAASPIHTLLVTVHSSAGIPLAG